MAAGTWLALVAVAAVSPVVAADAGKSAAVHTVTVEDMRFTPAVLTVRRGERVVWVNKDLFPHTVTSDGQAFDSGQIVAGGSWTFVAHARGAYSYHCTLHPTMKAQLIVR